MEHTEDHRQAQLSATLVQSDSVFFPHLQAPHGLYILHLKSSYTWGVTLDLLHPTPIFCSNQDPEPRNPQGETSILLPSEASPTTPLPLPLPSATERKKKEKGLRETMPNVLVNTTGIAVPTSAAPVQCSQKKKKIMSSNQMRSLATCTPPWEVLSSIRSYRGFSGQKLPFLSGLHFFSLKKCALISDGTRCSMGSN